MLHFLPISEFTCKNISKSKYRTRTTLLYNTYKKLPVERPLNNQTNEVIKMKKLARRKNKRQKEQDNVKRTEINTLKKKSRIPIKWK